MAARNNRGWQMARHTAHPSIPYGNAYRNANHARRCPAVRMTISHHGIVNTEMYFRILASGLSILAALFHIGIALA